MTTLQPGARELALKLAGVAPDAAALRDVLDALGLLQKPQPAPVPAHTRHTRAAYVAGCARCRTVNRRYVAAWRNRRQVTNRATMKPTQLTLWSD